VREGTIVDFECRRGRTVMQRSHRVDPIRGEGSRV
jgi:hypothetical protein